MSTRGSRGTRNDQLSRFSFGSSVGNSNKNNTTAVNNDDDDYDVGDDYGFASIVEFRGSHQNSWAPGTDVSSEGDHLVQTIDELLSSESSMRGDDSQDELDYNEVSQKNHTKNHHRRQNQLQIFHGNNQSHNTSHQYQPNHHYKQHLYRDHQQHQLSDHGQHHEQHKSFHQHDQMGEHLVEPVSITGGLIVDGGGKIMGGNVIGVTGGTFSQNSSLQRFALRQRDPVSTIADLYSLNADIADHRRHTEASKALKAAKQRAGDDRLVGARLANSSLSHHHQQNTHLIPDPGDDGGACECEYCQYNSSSALSTFRANRNQHHRQQQHHQQQQIHSRLSAWSSTGQQFKMLSLGSKQNLCTSNSSTTIAAIDSNSSSGKRSSKGLMASPATFDRTKNPLARGRPSGRRNQTGASQSTMKAYKEKASHSPSLSRCAKLTKLILILAQLAFVAAGICIGAWGILSQVEDYKYHLSTLYVFSEESPKSLLQLLSVAFIIMACLIFLFGSLGLLATHHNSKWMSSLFVLLVLVVFALNLAIGLMAIILQERLAASIRSKLVNKFQEQYGIESPFTSAVDYVQTKYECCGIEGSFDYERSLWRLQRLGGLDAVVARTCCRLQNSSDDLAYINPRPANETMCQSNDIRFQQNFRFRKGCTENIELLLRQKIWIYVICCSVLSAIILLILVLAISFCSALKKRQDYREKAAATQAAVAAQQQHQQQVQANLRPPSSTRSTLM